jgi:uncharacterized phage protein gp47/JayE
MAATIATNTGSVNLSWTAVTGATGYNIYRIDTPGSLGFRIDSLTGISYLDQGGQTLGPQEPDVDSTAGILVDVTAVSAGSDGNVGANAIIVQETPIDGITIVTNPAATVGGTDVESDDAFRQRILGEYQGHGAGNRADYISWLLAINGVERAACIPVWAGPGTVLAVPMLADGSPVSGALVTQIQALLDPTGGFGDGEAPIGANVHVATTVPLSVVVSATIVNATGYSLSGASGTVATFSGIQNALQNYLVTLNPGDTLSYQQVLGAMLSVPGVAGVNSLTVNGAAANIALGLSPPQTAILDLPLILS